MQIGFELEQFLHFTLNQSCHGNAGPFGNHLGDVVFGDFFAQQGFVGPVFGGEFDFLLLKLALQGGQRSVFQFSCFVEVVTAFGLIYLELHAFHVFFEGRDLVNRPFFLLPLSIQVALLFTQLRQLPFNAL